MAYGKKGSYGNGGKSGIPTGSGQSGTGTAPKLSHGGNANVKASTAKKFC